MALWTALGGVIGVLIIAAWLAFTWANDDDAAAPTTTAAEGGDLDGETIARDAGCIACHSTDGSDGVGPTWAGLARSERESTDGETVTANRAYLRESIEDPAVFIVAGFDDVMPQTYTESLTGAEIRAIVDYILTLE